MNYSNPLYKVYHWFASIPPKITFKNKNPLTPDEKERIIHLLADGYYVILTGNKYHASSVLVKIMTYFKLGKPTKYSHALMNCDFMSKPEDVYKFKFMEATVAGVHYSRFDEVFDCDTVCLLSPKNLKNEDWTNIIDGLIKNNGKPYDDLFQLSDETHISCVELVRNALKNATDYEIRFAEFEEMIKKEKNLLPQMFRDCTDFQVVLER